MLIILIYAFITRERNVSFGPKIRDEFYEKMRLVYLHTRYVSFFHLALWLLYSLLTMFQRWATLCVNVASVRIIWIQDSKVSRAFRISMIFFFFFTFVKKTSRIVQFRITNTITKWNSNRSIINWTNYNCRNYWNIERYFQMIQIFPDDWSDASNAHTYSIQ